MFENETKALKSVEF